MFEKEFCVRYSELGSDALVSPARILAYWQDTTMQHSQTVGQSLRELSEAQLAWLLLSWRVEFSRFPAYGETLLAHTWATHFEGIYGYRDFDLVAQSGEVLAVASTVWVLVDASTGRMKRVTQQIADLYGTEPHHVFEAEQDWKMAAPESYSDICEFEVLKSDLDTNQHVNNTNYVRMVQEVLPPDKQIRRLWVNYKKPAMYDDTVVVGGVEPSTEENMRTYVLHSPDNRVFSIVKCELE